jgi:hypothetical protein
MDETGNNSDKNPNKIIPQTTVRNVLVESVMQMAELQRKQVEAAMGPFQAQMKLIAGSLNQWIPVLNEVYRKQLPLIELQNNLSKQLAPLADRLSEISKHNNIRTFTTDGIVISREEIQPKQEINADELAAKVIGMISERYRLIPKQQATKYIEHTNDHIYTRGRLIDFPDRQAIYVKLVSLRSCRRSL